MLYVPVLALALFAPAPEDNPLPTGMPPQLTQAQIQDGKLIVYRSREVFRTRMTTIERTVDGKTVKEMVPIPEAVWVVYMEKFELKGIQATDADGTKLDEDALKRVLTRWTTVAVAGDGRPVEAIYRKALKKDTVVLVLPVPKMPAIPGKLPKIPEPEKLPPPAPGR
jgi:hypothetical protein